MKVLGPKTDFSIWGSCKGTENPPGIWHWRSVGFDYKAPARLGKERLLEGKNKPLCTPGLRRKEQGPHQWLSHTCLWGFESLRRRHGWTVACLGVEALTAAVLGGAASGHDLLQVVTITPTILLTQLRIQGTYPNYQDKTGLKIYRAWPCSPEQDPVFPTASSSHQEASTSLLFSYIRGQTEWKPQSQKTSQNDSMDHSF